MKKGEASECFFLVEVTVLSFLQCTDIVGWVKETACGLQKTCAAYPQNMWRKKTEEELANVLQPSQCTRVLLLEMHR